MTPPATLIFLRHAHTAPNDPGDGAPMSGGLTDTALSALGETQAALLARRLGPGLAGVPIYTSPLGRAVRTAEALAAASGSPVTVRAGLREIHCGHVEGMTISEVKRRYPRVWEENEHRADPDFRWPGGESYGEFRCRCVAEARAIAAAHEGGRALVVTHAGVIGQIVGAVVQTGAGRWDLHRPGNASVTELLWAGGGGTLVRFDDRGHLAP